MFLELDTKLALNWCLSYLGSRSLPGKWILIAHSLNPHSGSKFWITNIKIEHHFIVFFSVHITRTWIQDLNLCQSSSGSGSLPGKWFWLYTLWIQIGIQNLEQKNKIWTLSGFIVFLDLSIGFRIWIGVFRILIPSQQITLNDLLETRSSIQILDAKTQQNSRQCCRGKWNTWSCNIQYIYLLYI